MNYLKKVTLVVQDNDFLIKQLEAVDVKQNSILYKYATAAVPQQTKDTRDYIYPFGSNKSQRQAIVVRLSMICPLFKARPERVKRRLF